MGSDGRYYKENKSNYGNFIGLLNDHYCIPVNISIKDSPNTLQPKISELLKFFRDNSINFDRIICEINENDSTYIKSMKHIFSCAPLGRLTYVKHRDIETIPRPMWGISTFHNFPDLKPMKIGLYLFESKNVYKIQIHQFGIDNNSFDSFSDTLSKILNKTLITP